MKILKYILPIIIILSSCGSKKQLDRTALRKQAWLENRGYLKQGKDTVFYKEIETQLSEKIVVDSTALDSLAEVFQTLLDSCNGQPMDKATKVKIAKRFKETAKDVPCTFTPIYHKNERHMATAYAKNGELFLNVVDFELPKILNNTKINKPPKPWYTNIWLWVSVVLIISKIKEWFT